MRKVLLASAVSVVLTFSTPFSTALAVGVAASPDIAQQVDAPVIHTNGHSPIGD